MVDLQKIKLKGGAEVTVDLSNATKCKKCEKKIWFGATKNNRLMPISQNEDGEYQSHFSDCEFAKSFRKKTWH